MSPPLAQHQFEVLKNLQAWESKPLLREIYGGFYQRIAKLLAPGIPGRTVEIGSGIGGLKTCVPRVICTDLFPNPWLDLVCDGYELPFASATLSHLVLFDVFHHLSAPNTFVREARRVLSPNGRLILFEPYVSWGTFPIYGWLHPEPVAWRAPINLGDSRPGRHEYYAGQGNATRLFFCRQVPGWPAGWKVFHAEAFSSFSYLFSGGFSRPQFYPLRWLPWLKRVDEKLSRWPRLFGARCLVGLTPE